MTDPCGVPAAASTLLNTAVMISHPRQSYSITPNDSVVITFWLNRRVDRIYKCFFYIQAAVDYICNRYSSRYENDKASVWERLLIG